MNQILHNEISDGINKLFVNFHIHHHVKEYLDLDIQATINNYLHDYYFLQKKIWDFKIYSKYPDVEIIIQYSRFPIFDTDIKILKFERLKKIEKLDDYDKENNRGKI